MIRELSVIQHLDELRRRILISLLSLSITTILSFPFSQNILRILKNPARGIDALVFFGPEEALLILMRISIFSGIVLASPVISYQLWLFVSPAVDDRLRKYSFFFVISVFVVFILGSLFAYFILLPRALVFLLSLQNQELKAMISASRYISFVSNIILATGLVFQMPVLIFLLSKAGLINAGILRKNFKFALVAIIVIAAIITPTTDIFNMLMLAIPMLLLYEISIWVAFFVKPLKR